MESWWPSSVQTFHRRVSLSLSASIQAAAEMSCLGSSSQMSSAAPSHNWVMAAITPPPAGGLSTTELASSLPLLTC